MTKPDFNEAGRKAHELHVTHGAAALSYAKKMADAARAAGNAEEFEFWNAVYNAMKPRNAD